MPEHLDAPLRAHRPSPARCPARAGPADTWSRRLIAPTRAEAGRSSSSPPRRDGVSSSSELLAGTKQPSPSRIAHPSGPDRAPSSSTFSRSTRSRMETAGSPDCSPSATSSWAKTTGSRATSSEEQRSMNTKSSYYQASVRIHSSGLHQAEHTIWPWITRPQRDPGYIDNKEKVKNRLRRHQLARSAASSGWSRRSATASTSSPTISAAQAAIDKVALALLDGHSHATVTSSAPRPRDGGKTEDDEAVGRLLKSRWRRLPMSESPRQPLRRRRPALQPQPEAGRVGAAGAGADARRRRVRRPPLHRPRPSRRPRRPAAGRAAGRASTASPASSA